MAKIKGICIEYKNTTNAIIRKELILRNFNKILIKINRKGLVTCTKGTRKMCVQKTKVQNSEEQEEDADGENIIVR